MCLYSTYSVDGGWSVWASWSECDVICGIGSRSRPRTCDNPPPANGGDDCVGSDHSTDVCVLNTCPGIQYPACEDIYLTVIVCQLHRLNIKPVSNRSNHTYINNRFCYQFTAVGAIGQSGPRAAQRAASASGDGTGVATRPGRLRAATTATATTSTMKSALDPIVMVSLFNWNNKFYNLFTQIHNRFYRIKNQVLLRNVMGCYILEMLSYNHEYVFFVRSHCQVFHCQYELCMIECTVVL